MAANYCKHCGMPLSSKDNFCSNWVSATVLETGQVVYFQWGYGTPVKQWVDNVLAA